MSDISRISAAVFTLGVSELFRPPGAIDPRGHGWSAWSTDIVRELNDLQALVTVVADAAGKWLREHDDEIAELRARLEKLEKSGGSDG